MKTGKKIGFTLGCLAVFGAVTIFSAGCGQKGGAAAEKPLPTITTNGGSYTIQAEPPTGVPTEYNGLENISFMAYKLAHTEAFHTEAESTVNTTIGFISYVQNVKTYKDYADGVMLVEDITKSSLVNTAQQTCFVGDRALWRSPASARPGDWRDKETAWATVAPSNYSVEEYMKIYGLPSTEFCVYVLNEETLTKWSEVTDNGDGTYTQTVYPSVDAAGAYYAIRMKTMGGLSSYPTFNSIAMTYTFTADWTVLSCEVEEDYAVDLGILHSDHCKATTRQSYYYDREGVDISDYSDFFSRYVAKESEGDVEEETKKELTATDCLSAAFGEILVKPKELLLSFRLDGTEGDGRVYVDLGKEDFRVSISEWNVWYVDENLYLSLADGMAKISSKDLISLVSSLSGGNDATQSSVTEDFFASLDFDKMLEELGGGTFVLSDTGASLDAELTFGETILPLHFAFSIEEEGVTLDYVELKEISFGGKGISARLCFAEESILPELTVEQKESAGDLMTVVNGAKECAEVLKNKEFSFALAVKTAAEEKEDYYFLLTVTNGRLYLSVSYYADETNANYAPLLLQGELSELASLLETAKKLGGYDIPFLEELLSSILPDEEETQFDVSDLLTLPALLKSFSLTEEELTLSLDGKILNMDGDAAFLVRKGEKTFGFEAALLGYRIDGELTDLSDATEEPTGEYIDVSTIGGATDALLNSLFSVDDNVLSLPDEYHFAGRIGCAIGGYTLDFDVAINFVTQDGGKLNLSIGADSAFAVNSGRYLSYMTWDLRKGTVYLQRIQYEYYSILTFKTYAEPVVTYRSMTAEELFADYWNQITYLTNMGEVVSNLIKDQIDQPADPSETPLYDVGSYVLGYGYTAETGEYALTLNGKNFADFLGDMVLRFTVNEEGLLTRLYGSVEIYVTLSLDLQYENVTSADDYTLTKKDLSAEWLTTGEKEGYEMTITSGHTSTQTDLTGVASYVSSVTLQNGEEETSFTVVYGQTLDGLPVLPNTDRAQFVGWFTLKEGGTLVTADTADFGLGGGTLYARWVDYVRLTLDAGEGTASATEIKEMPDGVWTALQSVVVSRSGYEFVGWTAENGETVTEENILSFGGMKLVAVYKEVLYMTFVSDVDSTEYRSEWTASSVLPQPTAEGYRFFGWALLRGGEYELKAAGEGATLTENTTAYALWICDDLKVSVTNYARKKLGFFYTWEISGEYTGGGFAKGKSAELAETLGVTTSAQVLYRLSDNGTDVKDTLNNGNAVDVSGGAFSKSGLTSMKDGAYVGALLEVCYSCGDVTLTLTSVDWKQR